ncbi:MAG: carboxypeptidase regulatory-like domain-containing protein, partial [Acidobacteria bacterium]|nr:carboxypeptidase regulatory-like domain-containing protein [Acidobacteriota bacterium]
MEIVHKMSRKITLVILAGLIAATLVAQVERATISGIIHDKSGAALPEARVDAENLATGVRATSVTNSSGNYYLPLLAGGYKISVSHAGFSTAVVPNLTLTVGQNATVSLALEVSSLQQQVTVVEVTPLIDQETASLGATINSEQISELPLLGRNAFSLVVLAPGVNPKGNPGTGPLISGGRSNANAVLLDGAQMLNSTTNDTSYSPPLESVQQFKVQTSSFQAEYGRTAGGVLNVTTKMGTNEFHGAVYEYFRNDALNANTYSNNLVGLRKSVVRRNEFGGALGGPVLLPRLYNGRNRTFFFLALEAVPDRAPQSLISNVPSTLQRNGDFSQTFGANGRQVTIYDPTTSAVDSARPGQYLRQPFPGNQIPAARISPVSSRLLAYYPQPNAPGDAIVGTRNFLKNGNSASAAKKLLARFDHSLSDRQRLFGRAGVTFNSTTSTAVINDAFPQQTSTAFEPITSLTGSAVAGDTITFRPNLIAEFRVSYLRNHKDSVPSSMGFDLTQLGFSPAVAGTARAAIFPGIAITGQAPLGTATTALRLSVQENRQAQGVFTWVTGKHTVKAGGDFEIFRNNTYSPSSPAGTYSFNAAYTQGANPTTASPNAGLGLGSFLLGLPASGSLSLDPALAAQQVYYAGFVQDNFKISRRFTLDLGLRYELTTPWQDRFNNLAYFDPATDDVVTGRPGAIRFVSPNQRGQTDTQTRNFGPRAGISWLFAPKTTFRAGYGMFYAQGNRGIGAVSSELGQGFQTSTSVYLGPAGVNPYVPPVGANMSNPFVTGFLIPPSNLVGGGVSTIIRNVANPTQHQWTANIQRQVTSNLVIETAYSGSRGLHIWQDTPLNAAHPVYLSLGTASAQQTPNPFFGKIATGTLSAATVVARQLLLPFPQYTSINLHQYPVGDSSYHAFIIRLDKRVSRGFTVLASYTASKQIDNVGEHFSGRSGIANPYDLRMGRSLTDYDVPQRLVVSYIWQLPRLRQGIAGSIIGAWQMNGITSIQKGMPIVITAPNTAALPGLTSRADRLRSGVLSSGQTRDHWFDTTAFTAAPAYTLGTDSRSEPNLRSAGMFNFDFSLMRNIQLHERIRLQVRAEAFNIMNHAQLNEPDSSVNSPTFGRILGGSGNRSLQLGA